MLVLGCTNCR